MLDTDVFREYKTVTSILYYLNMTCIMICIKDTDLATLKNIDWADILSENFVNGIRETLDHHMNGEMTMNWEGISKLDKNMTRNREGSNIIGKKKGTVMTMNKGTGGNSTDSQTGNIRGSQVGDPTQSTIAGGSSSSGIAPRTFMFDPTRDQYKIWDPNNTSGRGFNPQGGNQPYATNFADTLQYIMDTNDHKQVTEYFGPKDKKFWLDFCSYVNKPSPQGQCHIWNTKKKIQLMRDLP